MVKLIEPLMVIKDCFGYNYSYEIASYGIPIVLIILGSLPSNSQKKKFKIVDS